MKHLLVRDIDLNNYLLERGFTPIKSNSQQAIYVKNEEIQLAVNGWHWKSNRHSKYSGHYDINSQKELELEFRMMEATNDE